MKKANEILVSISKELNVIQEQLKELHKMDKEFFEVKEEIKQPLFVTEDGVELNFGDMIAIVYTYERSNIPAYTHSPLIQLTENLANSTHYYKIFSCVEAAEAWIKENKPEFSRKQVLDAINKHYMSDVLRFLHYFKLELGL